MRISNDCSPNDYLADDNTQEAIISNPNNFQLLKPADKKTKKVSLSLKGIYFQDEYKLFKGKKKLCPFFYAWHLNLALLKDAQRNAVNKKQKEQISFLAANYLRKVAPLYINKKDKRFGDTRTLFQVAGDDKPTYHRLSFYENLGLASKINQHLALQDKSPLILTETTKIEHLFPLAFHVLSSELETKSLAALKKQLKVTLNDITLQKPILFDTTKTLAKFIKINGEKAKEKRFEQLLAQIKRSINKVFYQIISDLTRHDLALSQKKRQLCLAMKQNTTIICRVRLGKLAGIKILPVFSLLNPTNVWEEHPDFLVFIGSTGLYLGPIQMRRFVLDGLAFRKDIKLSLPKAKKGLPTLYYPTKESFLNTSFFKKFEILFGEGDELLNSLKETMFHARKPHNYLLGSATIKLLKGLFNEIDDHQWIALNNECALSQILQISLFKIREHIARAELYIANYNHFSQEIEFIHAELATLLEITHPFNETHFSDAYKAFLSDIIPNDLKDFLRPGLGKTSVNTFSAICAAIHKKNSRPRSLRTRGFYYEQAEFLENGMEINPNAFLCTKKVHLYAGSFSCNIQTDTEYYHYRRHDIINDIYELFDDDLASKHITIAIDATIALHISNNIRGLLVEFKNKIANGTLNVIVFNSGQKFDMFGMDSYYGAPFYMINNGEPQWDAFDNLLFHPAHKTDSLSLQWFTLSMKYAANELDIYRQLIFDNTRTILNQVPETLLPDKDSDQKIRISLMDQDVDASFIDIKILGPQHKTRGYFLFIDFYQTLLQRGVKAVVRSSFGFYHPNSTIMYDDPDSTTIRITPGLNAEEMEVINLFIKEKLLPFAHKGSLYEP